MHVNFVFKFICNFPKLLDFSDNHTVHIFDVFNFNFLDLVNWLLLLESVVIFWFSLSFDSWHIGVVGNCLHVSKVSVVFLYRLYCLAGYRRLELSLLDTCCLGLLHWLVHSHLNLVLLQLMNTLLNQNVLLFVLCKVWVLQFLELISRQFLCWRPQRFDARLVHVWLDLVLTFRQWIIALDCWAREE